MDAVVENKIQENQKEAEPKQEPVQQEQKEEAPKSNLIVEKLLKEKKNAMEKVRELESMLEQKEQEFMVKTEDYKGLSETYKQKYESVISELQKEKEEKINGHKLSSLKKELSKMGAPEESMSALLRLADINKLKYDEEHKVVLGLETVASEIKEAIPMAFGRNNAGVDQDAPNTKMNELDINSFKNLQSKDKKNPDILKQLYAKHGISMRD